MSELNITCALMAACQRYQHKHVHLGITGSVACYKSIELLRLLGKMGIHVSVTLSKGARQFLTPALFEALGAIAVYSDSEGIQTQFAEHIFDHLAPGQQNDVFCVIPASADALARLASGRACDMLSTQALAFSGSLLLAPAMNPRMWEHPATQANIALLQQRGATLVIPDVGRAACGDEGQGRLAPFSELFFAVLRALSPQDMGGQRVLITLGPTREAWDGVRFWSNPSTGRMGAALATVAWARGAEVFALCGPGCPALPQGIQRVDVPNAAAMFSAAKKHWSSVTLGAFTAAVADFSPVPFGSAKFKKAQAKNGFSIEFTPNTDILATLAQERQEQKILGFAAETVANKEELLTLVREKRQRKDADIIAGNAVNSPDSGFGTDTNTMVVVDRHGTETCWPLQSKADVAWDLWSWLLRV